jgi:hypothetical protein
MPIFSGSRYATAKITALLMPDGSVRKYVHSRKILSKGELGAQASVSVFTKGIELDALTFQSYSSERLWWVLADVNEIVFPLFDGSLVGPNQLQVGNTIIVPSISQLTQVVSVG